MARKKRLTIPKVRGSLYKTARLLGDVQAIKTGKINKRISNRVLGKITGRGLRYASKECFIATTVYGDENAPQIHTLRNYRDNILIKNIIGRTIIRIYYSGLGEKTAKFIANNYKSSIPTIRKGLDILVNKIESHYNHHL